MSHALQVRCLLISQLRDLFISTSGIAGVLLYSKTRYELPDQPNPKGMELQTGRVQRSVRSETIDYTKLSSHWHCDIRNHGFTPRANCAHNLLCCFRSSPPKRHITLPTLVTSNNNRNDLFYFIYLVETYTKGRTATNMCTVDLNSAVNISCIS